MKTSGAHSVPAGVVHGASCDTIVAGTSAVCTQWASAPHAVSVETSTSGAPVYGHIGGVLVVPPPPPEPPPPPLQLVGLPMSHAPDGMLLSGLTHGAQRSSAAHTSCGKSDSYCLTCGTHTLKQTPSAPLSDLHVGGGAPPDLMNESGTQ